MATTTRRSSNEANVDTASRQITELAHAFRGYSQNVPGLKVDIVGHVAGSQQYVHPVAGFHVRMNDEAGSGISLYVSSRYGELVRWRQGSGALRERFTVHIDEPGFGWGDSTFPSAEELAHDLFAYMQFNLDAIRKN
ncbi:MAG: hypothetical protein KFH98_08280 [Gemmatimonadetes bacterium]|nr:hypothetical protein [Gemmatimonadota bacterium]